MSAVSRTPINKNYLSPTGGTMIIKKIPHVTFFCQQMNIPGIGFNSVPNQPTPFVKIPQTGDHLEFQELKLQFSVDEDLKNWKEIYDWIVSIGFPEDTSQFKKLQDQPKYTGEGIKSDLSLIINTNGKIPNIDITFIDAFPVEISGIEINTTDPSIKYVTATVTFIYEQYKFNSLN